VWWEGEGIDGGKEKGIKMRRGGKKAEGGREGEEGVG
jgi:hypothetical protein